MKWLTPKIDWQPSDKFNFEDYNRIKNNIYIVMGYLSAIHGYVDFYDMGDDIESYTEVYSVDGFNSIEENIELIGEYVDGFRKGMKMTFYPNGVFIKYDELNRIESILLTFENDVISWLKGLRRLPITLGRNSKTDF